MATIPTRRQRRSAIRREARAALASPAAAWARWYHDHGADVRAWADDHGYPHDVAIAAAATVSPGTDPAAETSILSWIHDCIARDETPCADNRPHGVMVPYGYGAYIRAMEVLMGSRGMPRPDIKTGNYGRAILEPDSPEWVAIDVWAWRTTCGDPLDSKRPLPSFKAGEYVAVRADWTAVAQEFGMTGSGLQAVCWVYRRGRP